MIQLERLKMLQLLVLFFQFIYIFHKSNTIILNCKDFTMLYVYIISLKTIKNVLNLTLHNFFGMFICFI